MRGQRCIIEDEGHEEGSAGDRCPTCGAKPGEKCELGTGQPRTEPHRNRRLVALDKGPLA